MSDLAVLPGDVGEVPSARAIRRFTVAAGRSRAGASLSSLLGDVYYAVISFAIGVAATAGAASTLRASLPPAPQVTAPEGLSLPTIAALALVGAAGVLISLAGRLGPVGAGGAEAAWWLALPVDRRGLLRPAARRAAVVAAVAGVLVVALLDTVLLGSAAGRVLHGALAGGVVAVVIVLAVALVQSAGVPRRRTSLVGDLILAGAGALAVGLAAVDRSIDTLPTPSWTLVGAAAVLAAMLLLLVDRRLRAIPAGSLREGGSVASQAMGAVVSFDSRELGRALGVGTAAPTRRWVSRLRTVRGPVSALVTADLAVLRRSPRHLVQLLLAALLPVLATVVPQLAGAAGVLPAVLIGGAIAASATGEGSRYGEMAPVLDRLLPLGAKSTRRVRLVVPAIVMMLWSLLVFAALGRWAGATGAWLALGIAGAPVWAAATVRGAYRPAPSWEKPLVSTPVGAVPTGVAAVIARGPDLVVLCLLPTWIAILLGSAPPALLAAQATLAAIAVLVGSSTRTKTFMDWLGEQMDEQAKR